MTSRTLRPTSTLMRPRASRVPIRLRSRPRSVRLSKRLRSLYLMSSKTRPLRGRRQRAPQVMSRLMSAARRPLNRPGTRRPRSQRMPLSPT